MNIVFRVSFALFVSLIAALFFLGGSSTDTNSDINTTLSPNEVVLQAEEPTLLEVISLGIVSFFASLILLGSKSILELSIALGQDLVDLRKRKSESTKSDDNG